MSGQWKRIIPEGDDMSIKERFDAVVKELNLDTRDNFTKMLALAFAGIEERDALLEENAKLKKHAEALAEYITDKHCSGVNCESCKLVNAFRADFPRKEEA